TRIVRRHVLYDLIGFPDGLRSFLLYWLKLKIGLGKAGNDRKELLDHLFLQKERDLPVHEILVLREEQNV
ncbi:hypothetical protein, partial [Candidatus Methylacidiphilum fumarolicum]|uniref:hypothetical protein n=1 Tax=Candidatus Methylacidiphilum fumarolicum TaxID=591154 RepID=UPI001ABC0C01